MLLGILVACCFVAVFIAFLDSDDDRDKALAVYHVLRRHCAALVELDRFINGEVKNGSKANK